MSDFFSRPLSGRQSTRLILLAIIVFTIPCYCLGVVMLAYAPEKEETTRAQPTLPTLGGSTLLPLTSPTITPFRTSTPLGGPLGPTPPQVWLPSSTPFRYATWTPYVVPTSFPTVTSAPTLTFVPPSATLPPSSTPTTAPLATNTQAPPATNTEAPPATNTEVPPATNTEAPPPTEEPPPTQETF
ncbi:MAG: hypothetical protein HY866_03270 [Chloroflexi bacterium]|nr:hypothetical protein [Chloroflexota bacterium]